MLDRRSFLIGAVALLTASFVRRASAFSRKAGEPLLLPLTRKPEGTLHIYLQDWNDYETNDYEGSQLVECGFRIHSSGSPASRRPSNRGSRLRRQGQGDVRPQPAEPEAPDERPQSEVTEFTEL
jgi:hypothetical protein